MAGLSISVERVENNSLMPKVKGKKNPALKGDFNLEKSSEGLKDVKEFLEGLKSEMDAFMQDKLDLMNPAIMTEEERLEFEEEMKEYTVAYKKAISGAELTDEEMRLIFKHNPTLYRILMEAKILREAYKTQLENCKSKEEVANLKLAYDLSITANIKEAKASGDEEEEMRQLVFKNTIDDEHKQFLETTEYQRLPNKVKKEEDKGVKNRNKVKKYEDDFRKKKNKSKTNVRADEVEVMKAYMKIYMEKKKEHA